MPIWCRKTYHIQGKAANQVNLIHFEKNLKKIPMDYSNENAHICHSVFWNPGLISGAENDSKFDTIFFAISNEKLFSQNIFMRDIIEKIHFYMPKKSTNLCLEKYGVTNRT